MQPDYERLGQYVRQFNTMIRESLPIYTDSFTTTAATIFP